MKRRRGSLYRRIAGIFLFLMLTLGGVILLLSLHASRAFIRETDQKLNAGLAADLAGSFEPYLQPALDKEGIQHLFKEMMVMNPRVELYLLDGSGQVIAYFTDPERIKRMAVDMGPIHTLLAGTSPPVLGDDPRSPDRSKPFSVTPVRIGEQDGYVYVILGGEQYDSVSGMVAESSILRTAFVMLALILLVTGVSGLVLFSLVTRRLHRVTETVERFREGSYEERCPEDSRDEIGRLGDAFNEMADTITSNIEDLERSDRLRRELIANVSHDLRSPLASVQGYVETILMKEPDLAPERRREFLETIYKNTTRLNQLVGELFELSILDARQRVPEREPLSLAELVQDVVLKFRPLADERGVLLSVEEPRGLSFVLADAGMLDRALSNLVDNAVHYTPPEGSVQVRVGNGGDLVTVTVTDSGPGIPDEDLPYVFDRFYQVEKSRGSERAGSGLGLAIARRILEAHDGEISARSDPGRGATFEIRLPAWRAPAL